MLENEVKLFSESIAKPNWANALMVSSGNNPMVAEQRKNIYGKVFSRYHDMKESSKMFSGMTEMPLLTNQYFNATMASYVRSFAGFLAIERDMDQPTAMLYYMDLLGVTDNRVVLGNVGKENLNNINARFTTSAPLDASDPSQSLSTGKKLLPGSIVLRLVHAADPSNYIEIKDDRKGNLLAPANVLSVGSVDYNAGGSINFTINTAGFAIAAGDSYSITAYEDVAGTPEFNAFAPGNNRFKLDQNHIEVTAEPDLLIVESNLMAMASMQKSLGVNPQDIAGAKLTELYTKLINNKLVDSIVKFYEGDTLTLDMTTAMAGYNDFQSRLMDFGTRMVDIDSALAKKSIKGINATAYLVGMKTAEWFRKLKATGSFVDNTDSTYINDLVGYYNGIPVLRHTNVGDNDGYAVVKTTDGQLAPSIRGIYLPLTNTPSIGSYQNMTQVAQGIYYSEAVEPIVPELVQKFTII